MGKWGTILFLIFLAVNVIGGIMQAQAKRKEEQRLREIAQRRRAEASQQPSSPKTTPGESRADQLQARRKAQLEELRRRRVEQSQPGSSKPQTLIRQSKRSHPTRAIPRQAAGGQRTPSAAMPSPGAAVSRGVTPAPPIRRVENTVVTSVFAETADSPGAENPYQNTTDTRSAVLQSLIRNNLSTPSGLRQAILLREIIDKPVSLRRD